jgi:hypothetical protein
MNLIPSSAAARTAKNDSLFDKCFDRRLYCKLSNIRNVVLLLFVPLLFVMALMLACSPYTSQSKVATQALAKQYYLVLPPDEVKYLFLDRLFSITPDEFANWAVNIWKSSTVNDIGRGDWLIYASYRGTAGTWKLTQEPPFEFTFLRDDAGAQYIEDSVLNPLWERPNPSDPFSDPYGASRQTHYATAMRPIDAYRAALKAATAKANGDPQANYLQGLADGLIKGITLKYEVHAVE